MNGDNWITDPANEQRFTEPGGNVNSLLLVTPPDYKTPALPDDGQTTASALKHEQSVPYLNYDRGQLSFELRTRAGDLSAVSLKLGPKRVPMKIAHSDGVYAFYRAEIPWDKQSNLSYIFEVRDGEKTEQFGANGLQSLARPFELDAKTYQPFVVSELG